MSYRPTIEGFEGQDIEVTTSIWTGPKLLVNGEAARKGSKRGQMLLKRNDGREVVVTWKQQLLGLDAPQLVVDGKSTKLVEPLKWYELVWSGLPILLLFVGGAIGGIAGVIGFTVNTKVFRANLQPILKYVVAAGVSVLAVVGYMVAAVAFTLLVGS